MVGDNKNVGEKRVKVTPDLRGRAYRVLSVMAEQFPNTESELKNWETPFQFLVAIILSAQTTDVQVNKISAALFKAFPTPESLIGKGAADVLPYVKSINYSNSKAGYIAETARILFEEYDSEVPLDVKGLMSLKGVGRKSAHVFLNHMSVVLDRPELSVGIGSDTHIMRTAQRMGLTKHKDPENISLDLERIYDQEDWARVNTLFVLYGRYICTARVKPQESMCVLKEFCSHCGGLGVG